MDYLKSGFRDGNEPGDYALLFRSGTHIHHFIDAFEREDIPYYVNSSRDFFNRPEIADLREIVRCILYPTDRMAWVHTLRSFFFGISDSVINRAIASGTTGFTEQTVECPREVREVNRQLVKLRQSILTIPLEAFLSDGDDFEKIRELSLNFFRMKLPFDLDTMEILGREYGYTVWASGGIRKRYVDLLLRDSGKLTVIDYKTDSFSGSSAEKVIESYMEKQRYYLRDISEIFGEHACGYLVFLREGIVYPVTPE